MRLLCIVIKKWPENSLSMDDFLNRMDDIAPLVETDSEEIVYVEVETLLPLYGGARQLIELFRTECSDFGVDCLFGLADGRFAAYAAAISSRADSISVVPEGKDRQFLAPLSVSLLPMDERSVAALADLGIYTLGDLARGGTSDLIQAFGMEAASWISMASASSELPLSHHNTAFPLSVSLSFDFPIVEKSQLIFAVKEPLSSLLSTLQTRSHGASVLLFRFYNESGETKDMSLSLAFPATEVGQLINSFRCHIASFKFNGAPSALDIKVLRSEPAYNQGELFNDKGSVFSDPRKVAELLERLSPLTGKQGQGWFDLVPSRIPEKMWNLLPWGQKSEGSNSESRKFNSDKSSTGTVQSEAGWPLLPGFGVADSFAALRLLPVPSTVGVDVNSNEEPSSVDGTSVVSFSGPFRTLENWWELSRPAERFYYEALMENGMMLWLYRKDESWYLQGLFD